MTSRARHSPLAWMIGVLLLAAALRILGTTAQSLWLDEGFTYNVIVRAGLGWDAMFAEIARDTHPPLYFVLLRLWTLATGDSVLALRLFSGLTAMLSVALVYRLARLFAPSALLAVAAALLLALWDADIFLAQETRMYAQRTLLACLSMGFYLHWLRRPSVRRAVPWALANAALMYTQYLGGFIPLVQGLHVLIFLRGRKFFAAVAGLAAAGILFLPWFLGVTLGQAATPPPYEMLNAPPSTWETLTDLRTMYFGKQWPLMFGLILMALWALRSVPQAERRWRREMMVLWLMWLAVPVTLTYIANFSFPLLMPRNLSLITPAAALLVAAGVVSLNRPARVLILGAVLVNGLTSVDFYQPKPPWDKLGADMARYAAPGDLALMEVGNGGYPLGYYLDHLMPSAAPVMNLPRTRDDYPESYYALLNEALGKTDTVWLAHWSPEIAIFDILTDAGFTRTATMTTDHVGNALNAYRYDRIYDWPPLATFANGLTLRSASIFGDRVDLMWTAAEPPDVDYSVSVFVLNANGELIAQHDGYPFLGERPTSAWEPGAVVFDPHPLAQGPDAVQIGVKVYTWWDGEVVPTSDGDEYVIIFPPG